VALAPGARGPRFIEPPEPPVPTPLKRRKIENSNVLSSLSVIPQHGFCATTELLVKIELRTVTINIDKNNLII